MNIKYCNYNFLFSLNYAFCQTHEERTDFNKNLLHRYSAAKQTVTSAAKQAVTNNKSLRHILVFVSLAAKYFIHSDGIYEG
jgi:hypothetical protein